jgi:hypothetical protein
MIFIDELSSNSFAYNYILKACNILSSVNENHKLCVASFEECCDAGYVNYFVLTALRKLYQKGSMFSW